MKLLAVDSNSILHRAFYGIKLLTTKSGQYTNAIYGFLSIMTAILGEVSPDGVVFAFDMPGPTFRHEFYAEYKAGRRRMPDELRSQMEPLKTLLTRLGYQVVGVEGFEADDILGACARLSGEQGWECVIATGDRDSLQLVSPHTAVRLASTKAGRPISTLYDVREIEATYGVSPSQLIEVKALMGDSSDNIPGVAGVGEKTALQLISRFGSVEGVYENLDSPEIKPGVRAKLIAGRETANLSRRLAIIRTDAPIAPDLTGYLKTPGDPEGAISLLTSLEMGSMIRRLGLDQLPAETAPAAAQEFPALIPVESWEDFAAKRLPETLSLLASFGEGRALTSFCLSDGTHTFLSEDEALFRRLLTDSDLQKDTHGLKELYRYALLHDLTAQGFGFDAEIAAYLLSPTSSSYPLGRLLMEYGCLASPEAAPLEAQCAGLVALCRKMRDEIKENQQEFLLYEVEMPLTEVLASMEHLGFLVDAEGLRTYGQTLAGEMEGVVQEVYRLAGHEFNLNSPKQLGVVLFEELNLPFGKKTKTGYVTNVDVLETLRPIHPIAERVLRYRKLQKLVSTYVEGLGKVIAPDGRIHSSFNQTETRTGRISSAEPNMQNIPVRTPEGSELRKFFGASPGYRLVDADYSQIELRILASIADDHVMIGAFGHDDDIHTITASQVFGMPPELITPVLRSRAKAVNFGIVYGIGAFSLSQDIGVTVAEADRYIKGYLNTYQGVRDYMEESVRFAKEHGYAATLFGRRRALPELKNQNRNLRQFGERVAMNTPIQGTAADIIKIAMVKVYRRLRDENLRARLILQVHDELIVEAPEDEVGTVSRILKEEMEGAAQLSVRLVADVHDGLTWYAAKG